MQGKRRVNLKTDPPPDLAIEIDVTSKAQMDAYINLRVPELWIYEQGHLKIYTLQPDQYQLITCSPTFPGLPVLDWVQEVLQQCAEIGRSPALRAFRKKIRNLELPFA